MGTIDAIPVDALYRRRDPAAFPFETTDEVDDPTGVVSQPRAVAAAEFGVGMVQRGYNIFALGPPGTGKHSIVTDYLAREAADRPTPPDLCYIYNFSQPRAPKLLVLPPGVGGELQRDMLALVEELRTALRSAFESDDYHTRRQAIDSAFKERSQLELRAIEQRANQAGLALLPTQVGLTFVPNQNGELLNDEQFATLPSEEQARLQALMDEFGAEMQRALRQVPMLDRARRKQVRELNRLVSDLAAGHLMEELREKYAELPHVVDYLEAVGGDVIEHARSIVQPESAESESGSDSVGKLVGGAVSEQRYGVNVLVAHPDAAGAPVVYEDNPTYDNLVGRIEHTARMGALVADFTLIKPGALHRAHGGFLLVEAHKILRHPQAWEALKRALQSRTLRIESAGQAMGLMSTVSLDPEPLDLDVRVVLVGDPKLYYLLCAYDPDFEELFKVAADFDDVMAATDENVARYVQLLAMLIRRQGLRPFDRTAMARLVEHSQRLAGDQEKLSARMNFMTDLLREADYRAGRAEVKTVATQHVQEALDAHTYRSDRLRERMHEAVDRGTIKIEMAGERVGQVNGLSVLSLGNFAFGQANRITARVRVGAGNVVDIEREVELGGPLHSKGVLILSGYLGARYAPDVPLSLSASLVFEQSYGGVDGDSASSAELYALLSAIAGVPIKQCFAVTGSVNQHGEVQAIGGVNEKIEGFFDICRARGLTGEQAVLIPEANARHLMLREDVREAVAQGAFGVYPIASIDQGIELLTGVAAPDRGENGRYPEGTFNDRVERAIVRLAHRRRAFLAGDGSALSGDNETDSGTP